MFNVSECVVVCTKERRSAIYSQICSQTKHQGRQLRGGSQNSIAECFRCGLFAMVNWHWISKPKTWKSAKMPLQLNLERWLVLWPYKNSHDHWSHEFHRGKNQYTRAKETLSFFRPCQKLLIWTMISVDHTCRSKLAALFRTPIMLVFTKSRRQFDSIVGAKH